MANKRSGHEVDERDELLTGYREMVAAQASAIHALSAAVMALGAMASAGEESEGEAAASEGGV